jgi:hypothetical protein
VCDSFESPQGLCTIGTGECVTTFSVLKACALLAQVSV